MMLYEILNFAIPNADIKESGLCLNEIYFTSKNFLDSGIRITLHGAKLTSVL